MEPIRVLQVFTIMDRGGAESMIMNYYRQIDKSKIQFDFLVHRKEKAAFDNEIESLGGKIYRLNPINPFFPGNYYSELRAFFIQNPNYKVIHSHINTFSCFTLKIAKEFKIPCRIAHAHIAIEKISLKAIITKKESIRDTLKILVKLQLRKKVKNDATHFFSCGKKAGKWLFGNTEFSTMNNAIDTDKFKYNKIISEQYKSKFNLENNLVLGHVGRFETQKNHSFLLEIFASILTINKNVSLVLIGDGPLRKNMEKKAKKLNIYNKVKFLGVRSDIPELFQLMDVFVFPSLYEGLPVTLIEAQASGTKILASNTISNEVNITDMITFLTLEESSNYWAQQILKISIASLNKENTKDLIVKSGYDIYTNAEKIQSFFIQQQISNGRF